MILLHVSIEHEGSAEYLFHVHETEFSVAHVPCEPISIATIDGSAIVEIRIGDKDCLNLDGHTIPADVRDVDLQP